MNKYLIDAYLAVDPNYADQANKTQAWKHIAKISSVQDFKPHYRIRMVASLLLQRLNKGAEIQHGTIGEHSYAISADTKAIMLGLTRKDLMKTKKGRIVSRKKHAAGKKALKRLTKAGYKAKKGTFKLFKK
jgi:hypothetical protein